MGYDSDPRHHRQGLDLPAGLRDPARRAGPVAALTPVPDAALDLPFSAARRQALESFELAYLDRVLHRASGNISEAARRSGMDRTTIRRLLKRHGRKAAACGEGEATAAGV